MKVPTNSRRFTRGQGLSAALALVTVLASACNDATTAPNAGTLILRVQTSGGDIDIDGYEFVVDSSAKRYVSTSGVAIQPDGTQRLELTLSGIKPGTHVVSLQNVADNCTVRDGNSRSVTVAAGEPASIGFEVVCVATGVEVTTHTTGLDQPFAYDLQVDGIARSVPPNDSEVVSRLEPGPHTISLKALPANCSLAGGAQTVTLTMGTIAPVHFEISCSPIVRLEKIAYAFDMRVGMPVGSATQRTVGLINPDGSGASVLGVGDSPSWSPDGRRLVLTEASCGYYDAYYGYPCVGGLVIVDPEMGSRIALAGLSAAFSPAWAPSGDLIAFTRCCENADRNRIYLVHPDGSSLAQLTIPQVGGVGYPGWSPDGKRIAFICDGGSTTSLCVIDRNGSGFARLTTNIPMADGRPAWKPDGTSIAFGGYSPGRLTIFLLDLASGTVRSVTDGSKPAWSRDGSRLVFSGVGTPGLFTTNVDGSYVTPVTTGAYDAPAWRP